MICLFKVVIFVWSHLCRDQSLRFCLSESNHWFVYSKWLSLVCSHHLDGFVPPQQHGVSIQPSLITVRAPGSATARVMSCRAGSPAGIHPDSPRLSGGRLHTDTVGALSKPLPVQPVTHPRQKGLAVAIPVRQAVSSHYSQFGRISRSSHLPYIPWHEDIPLFHVISPSNVDNSPLH